MIRRKRQTSSLLVLEIILQCAKHGTVFPPMPSSVERILSFIHVAMPPFLAFTTHALKTLWSVKRNQLWNRKYEHKAHFRVRTTVFSQLFHSSVGELYHALRHAGLY